MIYLVTRIHTVIHIADMYAYTCVLEYLKFKNLKTE